MVVLAVVRVVLNLMGLVHVSIYVRSSGTRETSVASVVGVTDVVAHVQSAP